MSTILRHSNGRCRCCLFLSVRHVMLWKLVRITGLGSRVSLVMQVNADAKRLGRRVLKKGGTMFYAETLDGVIGEPSLGTGCTPAQCQL